MDKRVKVMGFMVIFLMSSLIMFINLTKSVSAIDPQDDDDLTVTIHAQLFSEGSEIYENSLLPLGFYPFFDTPELNTGNYSHDLTRMNIHEVQYIYENETDINATTWDESETGNITIYTDKIDAYNLSSPKDTYINVNVSYRYNYYDLVWDSRITGLPGILNGFFYSSDGYIYGSQSYLDGACVKKFDTDMTYIETVKSFSFQNWGIYHRTDEGLWYVVDNQNHYIHRYDDSDWSDYDVIDISSDISWSVNTISWDGTYWYTNDGGNVVKWDSSWNRLSGIGTGMPVVGQIYFDGDYFWVWGNDDNHLFIYDKDLVLDMSSTLPSECVLQIAGGFVDGKWYIADFESGYSNPHIEVFVPPYKPFKNVFMNYSYSILNTNYTEIDLMWNISYTDWKEAFYFDPGVNFDAKMYGNATFGLNSTVFDEYNYLHDVIILAQNLTVLFNLIDSEEIDIDINVSAYFNSTIYKVPTEVGLKVNDEEVIDQSYNSGFIAFFSFPESLEFTANEEIVYFEFNLTSYFTYDMELDIISQTYLRKSFKLLSNHSISLTHLYFPETLEMLKIYLNNIDWGNDTITYLAPSVTMQVNQIFWLEVILGDEMYIPLSQDIYTYPIFTENGIKDYEIDKGTLYSEGDLNSRDFDNFTVNSTEIEYSYYYEGTYDFMEDDIDSTPLEWTGGSTGSSYTLVKSEYDGHTKVLDCYDASGTTYYKITNYFDSQTVGTIELWTCVDNIYYPYTWIRLYDTLGNIAIQVGFKTGSIYACNDATYVNQQAVSLDWFHFRIDFDTTTDTYDFYINDVLKADDYSMFYVMDYADIKRIELISQPASSLYHNYFDAFGYSWDADYDIGDNLIPSQVPITSAEINFTLETNEINPDYYQYYIDTTSKTNLTFQESNVNLYNYTSESFQLIDSHNITNWYNLTYLIVNITDFLSPSNTLMVNFYLENETEDFSVFVDVITISGSYNGTYKNQTTITPRTDINSVRFEEWFQANRSFKFWYFQDNYDINSISLKNNQTDNVISSFEINNSRYYFEELAYENDLFIATIDYNPNWVISYEIEINNGTYSKIKIDYQADFEISNVSIVLDLSSSGCYNENWTMNATQNYYNFKLIIPYVNFTSNLQTFYITGASVIPYVTISSYESDQNYNAITVDEVVDFAGFIAYPKFTKVFLLNKSSNWDAYNLYYGSQIYAVETISSTLIEVSGSGFDPAITSSYLHFQVKPFVSVDFDYNEATNIITITINSTMNVDNCEFLYIFKVPQAHSLRVIQGDIFDLDDKELEGYLLFRTSRIDVGITVIKIYVDLVSWQEMLVSSLLLFGGVGGFIGAYYYIKRNEEKMAKVKGWFKKKVFDKLERKKKEKEFDKIILKPTKDGKFTIESEK